MEKWDIYDKDRCKTGRIVIRGQKMKEGENHLVVHVCVFNPKGQLLIQQRQSNKEGWPGMWDLTAGGSALMGENSNQAAERELYEEIGYRKDLSNERPFFTVNFSVGFDDFYLLIDEIELETLRLQEEEVQKVMWATKEEILLLIENGKFVPYHTGLVEMIFQMKDNRGAFI